MFGNIAERFLGDAVDAQRRPGRQLLQVIVDLTRDGNAA